jgi:hypothetical protein
MDIVGAGPIGAAQGTWRLRSAVKQKQCWPHADDHMNQQSGSFDTLGRELAGERPAIV